MDTAQTDLFMSLKDELGKSYPTMHRWVKRETYPASICLEVERLTGGELSAVRMRPDLFTANQSHHALADILVDEFVNQMGVSQLHLMIGVLNFFESQQPSVYDNIILQLRDLDGGESFVNQRIAHKQNANG